GIVTVSEEVGIYLGLAVRQTAGAENQRPLIDEIAHTSARRAEPVQFLLCGQRQRDKGCDLGEVAVRIGPLNIGFEAGDPNPANLPIVAKLRAAEGAIDIDALGSRELIEIQGAIKDATDQVIAGVVLPIAGEISVVSAPSET